jgi:hypothetical protein
MMRKKKEIISFEMVFISILFIIARDNSNKLKMKFMLLLVFFSIKKKNTRMFFAE